MNMKRAVQTWVMGFVALLSATIFWPMISVQAVDSFPDQQVSGSIGIQGTISTAPPTRGATIAVPSNGAVFTTTPITVSGLCPSSVLVKLFANNVFVGSTFCVNGSYSLQIDLFSGQNDLVARVYDALDQTGPDSNLVHSSPNSVPM